MKPDAIIIGAGVNSLVAAAHLLSKGWRIEIFEGAPLPGGAVKSGEYTLPGFRHDWAAMNLSLFAGSQFHQGYAKELAEHGMEFAPVSDCFASVFPDNTWLGISNDLETNAGRIAQVSQADATTWRALSSEFPQRAEAIFAILNSPMSNRRLAGLGWTLFRKLKPAGMADLARFLLQSPRGWLDETFENDKVKALLAAWGMHLDFAPDIGGGALFPYLEGFANQSFGMALGKGGADRLTGALVSLIKAKGGVIHLDARVEKILTQNGTAKGIRLADGAEHFATKAVIANVAPSALHRLMGGTDASGFDRSIQRFSHAPGSMMIHCALDAPLPWAAGDALRNFAYVHIAPSLEQMARTYTEAKSGLLPQEPVIVVGQPTAADPSRAPADRHTLWLQVRMVPGRIAGDAGGTIKANTWEEAAPAMAERVLDILEKHAPGARNHIIAQRVVSPDELAIENPNLVGGDQICGSHHLSQHFMYRPARGYADGSTPLKGLHLTGAAVWPGAGTGAGPGFMLAQKLAGK